MTQILDFHLFNSLSRSKEKFTPINKKTINMYVCGVTVYDDCHLGHARVMLVFDLMSSFWQQQGWLVNYVRNITDIDDKIINRAEENQETIYDLTNRVIKSLHDDCNNLGMQAPKQEPKATDYMQQIMQMVERLLDNDCAYQTESGNVYFDVAKFKDYGKLSGKKVADLLQGVRVDVHDDKKSPTDFALWKAVDADPCWQATWKNGKKGRPGWHIECSAMSKACLGDSFDVHGGGPDLVFPHHENEIAQSESANKAKFANYWLHVGSLKIDNEKMSKSLGNFITIKQALSEHTPEVIRFFMFSTHYRKPINFSQEAVVMSTQSLQSLHQALHKSDEALKDANAPISMAVIHEHDFYKQWLKAMTDDFNTPQAIAILFAIAKQIKASIATKDVAEIGQLNKLLRVCSEPLGIIAKDVAMFLQNKPNANTTTTDIDAELIEQLITERNQVRIAKNWQRSDEIRSDLEKMNVELQDNPNGTTTWKILND